MSPYISPEDEFTEAYETTPSLDNAVKYANNLSSEYLGALSNQAYFNSGVGLTLIGVSAAAMAIGATGGSSDAIVGLGIGGAAAYLTDTFFYSKPRQLIYAAGASAISCSVSAIQPLRIATQRIKQLSGDQKKSKKLPDFTQTLANLNSEINELEAKINQLESPKNSNVVAATITLNEAKEALNKGRQAEVIIVTAGGALHSTVEQIKGKVNRALIDTEPNIQALVESLSSAIPLRAGQIAPIPKDTFVKPADDSKKHNKLNEDVVRKLIELTAQVATTSELVLSVVRLVEKEPTNELLKGCQVDIEKAGLNFYVSTTELNLKDSQTANIIISGGIPPYGISWTGRIPAEQVLQKSLNYQNDGKGVAIIEAKANLKNDEYSLLIFDTSVNRAIVEITTQGISKATTKTSTSDEKISEIQRLLAGLKLYDSRVDGLNGPETENGIIKFLKKAGPEEQANKTMVTSILKSKIDLLISWLRRKEGKPPLDWPQLINTTPVVILPEIFNVIKKSYDLLKERGCITAANIEDDDHVAIEIARDQGLENLEKTLKKANPNDPRLGKNTDKWLIELKSDTNKNLKCN